MNAMLPRFRTSSTHPPRTRVSPVGTERNSCIVRTGNPMARADWRGAIRGIGIAETDGHASDPAPGVGRTMVRRPAYGGGEGPWPGKDLSLAGGRERSTPLAGATG